MFILLYLVSGADKEDNGEGRKLRSRDKTTTTNIDPQGSEDDGASDSSVRENKKNKKSGGRNRALQNANDGTVGLERLMSRSAKEWLEFETEDLRCACLGVGLSMTGPRQVLSERLVEFYSSLSSMLPSENPHPSRLSPAAEPVRTPAHPNVEDHQSSFPLQHQEILFIRDMPPLPLLVNSCQILPSCPIPILQILITSLDCRSPETPAWQMSNSKVRHLPNLYIKISRVMPNGPQYR